jgi:adenine/guanine phosphoribosyltransferase-like PRPP-binding protein
MLPGTFHAPGADGIRTTSRTAFERRLLPALAGWFLERVRDSSPDYLIPVETKGARLLEAVLIYARDRLGSAIDVPVIYSTALPYLPPGALQNARVMIVDDAWRTGNNLQRHRRKIEEFGASAVDTVVCVDTRVLAAEAMVANWDRERESVAAGQAVMITDASNSERDRLKAMAQERRAHAGELGADRVDLPGKPYGLAAGDEVIFTGQYRISGQQRVENGIAATVLDTEVSIV